VNNEGDADHPSTERLWDLALTHRLTDLGLGILYGIATDDSHHYHEQAIGKSNSGRGWIMVRSSHLTPEFLVRAMEAGDFYASSGVTLAEVRRADGSLEVEIAGEPGVTYLTRFIGTRVRGQGPVEAGELGEERARSNALISRYTLQPDDLYVRAVITSSRTHPSGSVAHEFERAWTQPVVNERHAAFRNEAGATPPEAERPRRYWSSVTAATMIPPVTISWTQFDISNLVQPLLTTVMISAPTIVPSTVPRPPARLAPPITTAAMMFSSSPTPVVGSPPVRYEN
jgi:hypothetical protein